MLLPNIIPNIRTMVDKIDKSDKQLFLRDISAFELMEPVHLRSLSELVSIKLFQRDEVLWLQGQQVTFFTVVYQGRFRSVRRTSTGSEKLLSTLTRGRHFGLAEMITGRESSVTIIADEASTILAIGQKPLRQMLLRDADICYRLMQTMARTIFNLTNELERASFETVPIRLARLLLKNHNLSIDNEFSSHSASRDGYQASHEELATKLGVSRETISRTLAEFRKKGLIRTQYRKIKVVDAEGLTDIMEVTS